MLITKRALPRRTFLRGAGAALALPFAGRDGARGLRALADRGRSGAAARVRLLPQRREHVPVAEQGGRQRVRAVADPGAARPLPRRGHGAVRSRQRPGEPVGRRHRRPPARRFLVAERHPSAQERGSRRARGDDHRSDRRGRDRPGHAAGLAGALSRAGRLDGHLRRQRLQLRLYRLALVADADHAAAGRAQPAQRVRPDVRRRRHARGTACPAEAANRSVLDSVTEENRGSGTGRSARRIASA